MEKIRRYQYRIIALLFLAATINYVDRQVIGLLKPVISGDLGWSEAGYGYIVTAFQAAYAIGLLFSGRMLDKIGTRTGYSIAVLLWSFAGMAHAAARSVFSFGAARFFLGLGEAANFPASVKTVAEWFPPKERAFATGLFNSGSTFGAIIAPVIVTSITAAFGWRWAFLVTGSLGFIWIILWLTMYHSPTHKLNSISRETKAGQGNEVLQENTTLSWKEILSYRQTIAICLSRFVTDWVWWFFLFWTPDFLSKNHGINLKEMLLPLLIIYVVAAVGGIGGGWISSWFLRKGKSVDYARKTTILICAMVVLPIIAVSKIGNLWLAVGAISLAAAAHQGWASNIFTIVSDIFPTSTVASVTGLSGFTGAVGGALSATFVGWILEFTHDYFYIFLIAGLTYLTAWAILKGMIPEIKAIPIKTAKAIPDNTAPRPF